ncbi:MAG: hypothetical protein QGF07_03990 [Phycisphaerales bacterium]|nr:hypothetical protein [Phycisphaerales bacterium]
MKRASLTSFSMTIIIAVICGALVSLNRANEENIRSLITSSSTIDQLLGIDKLANDSFESLVTQLTPLLGNDQKVSTAASKAIVLASFRDSCVDKLSSIPIDPSWHYAAQWWAKKTNSGQTKDQSWIACDNDVVPWLRRLAALRSKELDIACVEMLKTMPLLDRDGSILLATLSIHKHLDFEATKFLVESWQVSIDNDQRKIAVLLQGLLNEKVKQGDSDPQVQNITIIINEQNTNLAWRTMHNPDGFIDPDIFLAGLIVNRNHFMQLLIETASDNRWRHPEHAFELARAFAPEIVRELPEPIQVKHETMLQWWDLFACGLLLERR